MRKKWISGLVAAVITLSLAIPVSASSSAEMTILKGGLDSSGGYVSPTASVTSEGLDIKGRGDYDSITPSITGATSGEVDLNKGAYIEFTVKHIPNNYADGWIGLALTATPYYPALSYKDIDQAGFGMFTLYRFHDTETLDSDYGYVLKGKSYKSNKANSGTFTVNQTAKVEFKLVNGVLDIKFNGNALSATMPQLTADQFPNGKAYISLGGKLSAGVTDNVDFVINSINGVKPSIAKAVVTTTTQAAKTTTKAASTTTTSTVMSSTSQSSTDTSATTTTTSTTEAINAVDNSTSGSHTGLIVAIVIVVVLLAGAGAALYFVIRKKKIMNTPK